MSSVPTVDHEDRRQAKGSLRAPWPHRTCLPREANAAVSAANHPHLLEGSLLQESAPLRQQSQCRSTPGVLCRDDRVGVVTAPCVYAPILADKFHTFMLMFCYFMVNSHTSLLAFTGVSVGSVSAGGSPPDTPAGAARDPIRSSRSRPPRAPARCVQTIAAGCGCTHRRASPPAAPACPPAACPPTPRWRGAHPPGPCAVAPPARRRGLVRGDAPAARGWRTRARCLD